MATATEVQDVIASNYAEMQKIGDTAAKSMTTPYRRLINLALTGIDFSILSGVLDVDSIKGVFDASSGARNLHAGMTNRSDVEAFAEARSQASELRDLFIENEVLIVKFFADREGIEYTEDDVMEFRSSVRRSLENWAHGKRALNLYGFRPGWCGGVKKTW